jgi:hypothetical protein
VPTFNLIETAFWFTVPQGMLFVVGYIAPNPVESHLIHFFIFSFNAKISITSSD